jgi:hypothetical protein
LIKLKPNSTTVLRIFVSIIFFAVAYFIAGYFLSKDAATLNAMLVKHSSQENQNLPKMLDAETRLDSISVENSTLKYHHTLIHTVKDSSGLDFVLIKAGMVKIAQENLDTNPVLKEYRDQNVSLQYIFRDKKKEGIFDYTVRHKKEKQ